MLWFFETIIGNTSMRCPLTEDNDFYAAIRNFDAVDFLLRFAGFEYAIEKEDMSSKIAISIGNGFPVFARMKNIEKNGFRIITGYSENDEIVTVGTDGQNGRPNGSPEWNEIEEIIVIEQKSNPTIGLTDAFRRIASILEENVKDGGVWDDCIKGFNFWGGVKIEIDELERRFNRMKNAAFYNFNSHFFAEQFRSPVYELLKDPRLDDVRLRINKSCDVAHMRNWQMVTLYEFRGDWTMMKDNVKEWAYTTCMLDCLKVLKACDEEILKAINDAISVIK
jgi:hypothetical protein